jgi:hypothetical protein
MPRRVNLQREADLARLAALYLQGKSQGDPAALGGDIFRDQVDAVVYALPLATGKQGQRPLPRR